MRTHKWSTALRENKKCSKSTIKKQIKGKKRLNVRQSFENWVVYKILNIENGRFYIGSSVDFGFRCKKHMKDLRENKHHSFKLQNDFKKYGASVFSISVIWRPKEPLTETELRAVEQSFIELQKPFYNIKV